MPLRVQFRILTHAFIRGSNYTKSFSSQTQAGERKRIKRRGFKTKKEAEEDQCELLNELKNGLDLNASKTLYSEFMKDWLRDKKTTVKKGTLDIYTWLVYNYILPTLGNIPLADITTRHIQNLYNDLMDSGNLARENVQKVHTIIKSSLGKAAGWDMIIKSPAAVVERPQSESKEMLYWTDEEAHTFLNVAKDYRYYIAFLLAITTGMRQGEIMGLRLEDVDLKRRTISVRLILSHDGEL